MPTWSAGDRRAIERTGVEPGFGLPGVHNLALWEALRDSPIRSSACATSRRPRTRRTATPARRAASGSPSTTGPGAANTLGAVGEAWASRSPVLVITTDIPTPAARAGASTAACCTRPTGRPRCSGRCRGARRAGRPTSSRPRCGAAHATSPSAARLPRGADRPARADVDADAAPAPLESPARSTLQRRLCSTARSAR